MRRVSVGSLVWFPTSRGRQTGKQPLLASVRGELIRVEAATKLRFGGNVPGGWAAGVPRQQSATQIEVLGLATTEPIISAARSQDRRAAVATIELNVAALPRALSKQLALEREASVKPVPGIVDDQAAHRRADRVGRRPRRIEVSGPVQARAGGGGDVVQNVDAHHIASAHAVPIRGPVGLFRQKNALLGLNVEQCLRVSFLAREQEASGRGADDGFAVLGLVVKSASGWRGYFSARIGERVQHHYRSSRVDLPRCIAAPVAGEASGAPRELPQMRRLGPRRNGAEH